MKIDEVTLTKNTEGRGKSSWLNPSLPVSDGERRNCHGDWQEVVKQNHSIHTTLGMKRISALMVNNQHVLE